MSTQDKPTMFAIITQVVWPKKTPWLYVNSDGLPSGSIAELHRAHAGATAKCTELYRSSTCFFGNCDDRYLIVNVLPEDIVEKLGQDYELISSDILAQRIP